MKGRWDSKGTTMVELMIAMVLASIVAIGFSSTLMFTRNMYNDSVIHSQLSQDAYVIDDYVRKKLTLQVADSLQIFANASDEGSGSPSSSGVILRSVRLDSTVDHLSMEGTNLKWMIDTVTVYPIDSHISTLLFTQETGYSKKLLNIEMHLYQETDSLELVWLISIRN
ncbi:prepilin-type N-terminal cleavage/methylation domain-containing protein [bacterium]|nr:prepilin-type N-terminal cleavage/methylation domain-containing protein [bacterium]